MVDLLYQHQVADPASLESTEEDVRKMLQTGTYALTYNWEGVLPEATDPRQSKAAPHIRVALLPGGANQKLQCEWCRELGDPHPVERHEAAWKRSSTWPAQRGRRGPLSLLATIRS